ncbi:hypothetical protein Pyn_37212 [Prunus yedoensis var. nudiflora]|uniref:Uncharacterized protein n=1 Tax=Prunus yedoensis var. nudiflora TaxID=2094558 RepID=A0A314XUW0_PRUYE|nr:hypothetical protein Pyn_37212 [Prunus yedoensis var. nudiflora]
MFPHVIWVRTMDTTEYGFWSSYVANGFQGTLKDGQEKAVKRLLKHSRQGVNGLKNEVTHEEKQRISMS